MADPATPAADPAAAPAAAPAVAPAPAPEPAAPAAAPVAAPAPVAAGTPSPDAPAPAAGGEPKPADKPADVPADKPGIKPHTDEPTLLEQAGKVEPKPGEKPADKPGEAKPGEKPADAPAADAPIVYEFKFPETIKAEPAAVKELSDIFGGARVPPEVAQKVIDVGSAAMTRYAENLLQEQHTTFAETRKGWVKQVMASEDLGGPGHQTAMAAVARTRDLLLRDANPDVQKQNHKEFNDFLRITGAGDHPWFNRMLYRMAEFLDEPAPLDTGINPTRDNGRAPKGTLRAALYTHPSSVARRES